MHLNFPGSLSSLFRLHQAETWHAPWRRHCNSLLNSSPLIFLEARQHGEAVLLTLSDPVLQTPAAPTDFGWSQSYLQHFPKIRPCASPVSFERRSSLEALGMLFVEASKAPPDLQEGKGGQDRGNAWVQLLFPPWEASALGCLFTPSSASSLIPKEVGPCSFALLLPPMHQFLSSLYECWLGTIGKSSFIPNSGESIGWKECKYPAFQTHLLLLPKGGEDTTTASSATAGVGLFKPHTKYLITDVYSSDTANSNQNPPNSCCSPREEHFIYLFLPLGKEKYLKANLARTRHEHA